MITPIECDFWRFGFILSDNNKLEIVETDKRHKNENIDIHICGGVRDSYSLQWRNKEVLFLQKYPLDDNSTPFTFHNYYGTQVRFWIKIDPKEICIEAFVEQSSIGRVQFSKFNKKYIHFAAWCDEKPFHLETTFKISSFIGSMSL